MGTQGQHRAWSKRTQSQGSSSIPGGVIMGTQGQHRELCKASRPPLPPPPPQNPLSTCMPLNSGFQFKWIACLPQEYLRAPVLTSRVLMQHMACHSSCIFHVISMRNFSNLHSCHVSASGPSHHGTSIALTVKVGWAQWGRGGGWRRVSAFVSCPVSYNCMFPQDMSHGMGETQRLHVDSWHAWRLPPYFITPVQHAMQGYHRFKRQCHTHQTTTRWSSSKS